MSCQHMFPKCSHCEFQKVAVNLPLGVFPLIRMGGDDGTRTHDPLLAKLTAANVGERHGAYGLISGACGAG
jgi:hypothetical protein